MTIDYSRYMQSLQNPLASAMQGYQMGAQIKQRGLQNKLIEAQTEAAQSRALSAKQQQEKAMEMQHEMVLLSEKQDKTAADYIAMQTKYPSIAEHYSKVVDQFNDEQRRVNSDKMLNLYSAINSGMIDEAKALLQQNKEAALNSNDPQGAKGAEIMLKQLELNPEALKTSAGMFLAKSMGEDQFVDSLTKMNADARARGMQPELLKEQKSKAAKAAIEADFAESQAAADLEQKRWNISKMANDIEISKANAEVAKLNRKAANVKDELAREKLELEIEEKKTERDRKVREKAALVQNKRSIIDNLLSTITEVENLNDKNPGLIDDSVGALEGDGFIGKLSRAVQPFDIQEITNFRNKMNSINSQIFLTQAEKMKGLGALTETEGAKLLAALDSIELTNDRETLIKGLATVKRLMMKSRASLVDEFGVPETVIDDPNKQVFQDDVMGALERNR